jgi:hypothetical protein
MYLGVVPNAAGPLEADETPSTKTFDPLSKRLSDVFFGIYLNSYREYILCLMCFLYLLKTLLKHFKIC